MHLFGCSFKLVIFKQQKNCEMLKIFCRQGICRCRNAMTVLLEVINISADFKISKTSRHLTEMKQFYSVSKKLAKFNQL